MNDDSSGRHRIFPTIELSNGALHIAWYDQQSFQSLTTPDIYTETIARPKTF